MVILYSTGCPRCTVLEKKLNLAGVEYELHSDVQEMLDKGLRATPYLEVDGEMMNFSAANTWVNNYIH